MRVIVQCIVPTENILKRDYFQQASVWTSFILSPCFVSPSALAHLPLKAHVMQATPINICCRRQTDVSAALSCLCYAS